jgi:4-amino-4-deoxy-L-arabinose transferase-like glycosyltransferase
MFMDGELYAAVAHNQANGYGTFWEPRFSQVGLAGLNTFHEHPPLFFGMQAAWFKVFGSDFWVERAYSFVMALITAGCMMRLWRELVPASSPASQLGSWSVFLWIIIPTVHWCFHNNMIECTMGVFTTAAVLFTVRGMRGPWWIWGSLAAIAVLLASLTKGLPGLFPLAAPVLLFVTLRQGSFLRAMVMSLFMTALVVLSYALLLQWPQAETNLMTYVDQRLLHRITAVPTVDNRFATLEMLLSNMLGPIVLSMILVFMARRVGARSVPATAPAAAAMALIGLSGVAPLMLTMVQKSFYMAAALPLCAMACALWSAPALVSIVQRWPPQGNVIKGVRMLGIVFIVGSMVAALVLFGTAGRDRQLLEDVHRIGGVLPTHTKAGLPDEMWNDWSLQTYLMRYHFISVDASGGGPLWYITAKGGVPLDSAAYLKQDIGLTELDLWRRL